MRSLILLLLLLGYSFTSCKKHKPDTQPEHQSNYISFKLNGQLWQLDNVQGGIWRTGIDDFKYIYLWSNNGYERICLYLNRPFVVGTKLINEYTSEHYYTAHPKNYGSFNRFISGTLNDTWMTSDEDTGHCTITFIDSIKNTITGDFAFRARNQRTGEIITISDGHFEKIIQ